MYDSFIYDLPSSRPRSMTQLLRSLIIEDSEADAIFVVRELTRGGYELEHERVDTRADLQHALDSSQWDLIIADYSLPGFNGVEALEDVHARNIDIPFIIVSGTIGEDIAVNAMKAGAHDYIIKGNLARLVPAVTRELRDAQIRRSKREMEEQLRATSLLLAKTFDSLSEAVFVLDPISMVVLRCNGAARAIFSIPEAEFVGNDLSRLFADSNEYLSFHARANTSLAKGLTYITDWTLYRGSGDVIHTEHFLTHLHDDSGSRRALLHVIRDITPRTLAEEDLRASERLMRALAARLQSVREEERAYISRELHDELGGAMTGLKMDLSWIARRIASSASEPDETTRARIHAMDTLIDETIQTIRRISSELRPGILDDLGLVAALDWHARDFERRTGIRCIADLPLALDEHSPSTSTALFRIFQEVLTNVARHAEARSFTVTLKQAGDDLIMTVHDDGRGITDEALHQTTSLGLVGMRERAEMLGGTFSIARATPTGTRVLVRIPRITMDSQHGGEAS